MWKNAALILEHDCIKVVQKKRKKKKKIPKKKKSASATACHDFQGGHLNDKWILLLHDSMYLPIL